MAHRIVRQRTISVDSGFVDRQLFKKGIGSRIPSHSSIGKCSLSSNSNTIKLKSNTESSSSGCNSSGRGSLISDSFKPRLGTKATSSESRSSGRGSLISDSLKPRLGTKSTSSESRSSGRGSAISDSFKPRLRTTSKSSESSSIGRCSLISHSSTDSSVKSLGPSVIVRSGLGRSVSTDRVAYCVSPQTMLETVQESREETTEMVESSSVNMEETMEEESSKYDSLDGNNDREDESGGSVPRSIRRLKSDIGRHATAEVVYPRETDKTIHPRNPLDGFFGVSKVQKEIKEKKRCAWSMFSPVCGKTKEQKQLLKEASIRNAEKRVQHKEDVDDGLRLRTYAPEAIREVDGSRGIVRSARPVSVISVSEEKKSSTAMERIEEEPHEGVGEEDQRRTGVPVSTGLEMVPDATSTVAVVSNAAANVSQDHPSRSRPQAPANDPGNRGNKGNSDQSSSAHVRLGEGDEQSVRTAGQQFTLNAVFRLLYSRVEDFNTKQPVDKTVSLIHPSFVSLAFDEGQRSPENISKVLSRTAVFNAPEVRRYFIPIHRHNHHALLHVGLNQDVVEIHAYDSDFRASGDNKEVKMLKSGEAGAIGKVLFGPGRIVRLYHARQESIRRQIEQESGLEVVINAENCLKFHTRFNGAIPTEAPPGACVSQASQLAVNRHRERMAVELREMINNDARTLGKSSGKSVSFSVPLISPNVKKQDKGSKKGFVQMVSSFFRNPRKKMKLAAGEREEVQAAVVDSAPLNRKERLRGGSDVPMDVENANQRQEVVPRGDPSLWYVYGLPGNDELEVEGKHVYFRIEREEIKFARDQLGLFTDAHVFRLLYSRVGKFNTGKADKDTVALLHPSFVKSIFDETNESSIKEAFNNLVTFHRAGVERFLIPIARNNHFVMVHAGLDSERNAVFHVYDSYRPPGFVMTTIKEMREVATVLFTDYREVKFVKAVVERDIPLQIENECGLETVRNGEMCLLDARFEPRIRPFVPTEARPMISTEDSVRMGRALAAAELEGMEATDDAKLASRKYHTWGDDVVEDSLVSQSEMTTGRPIVASVGTRSNVNDDEIEIVEEIIVLSDDDHSDGHENIARPSHEIAEFLQQYGENPYAQYGPPTSSHLFSTTDLDVYQIKTPNLPVSANAVFVLLFQKVLQFNTENPASPVGLSHPLLVSELIKSAADLGVPFDRTIATESERFRETIASYEAFGDLQKKRRFIVPVFISNRFILLHVGYSPHNTPTVEIFDLHQDRGAALNPVESEAIAILLLQPHKKQDVIQHYTPATHIRNDLNAEGIEVILITESILKENRMQVISGSILRTASEECRPRLAAELEIIQNASHRFQWIIEDENIEPPLHTENAAIKRNIADSNRQQSEELVRRKKTRRDTEGNSGSEPELDNSAQPDRYVDESAQKTLQKLPAQTKWEAPNVTPHIDRREDASRCHICNEPNSPHELSPNPENIPDDLMRCGHVDPQTGQCPVKFHPSCIFFAQPIHRFDSQYQSLGKNCGRLQCTDHYCERCVSDGYHRSAVTGGLDKVANQLRRFHPECVPIGSTDSENGLVLHDYKNGEMYTGEHLQACFHCGMRRVSGTVLKECSTCVNTYHIKCYGADRTQCQRCVRDEQTEYGKAVIVLHDDVFRVAICLPWKDVETEIGDNSQFELNDHVACRIQSTGDVIIAPLNSIRRVPPSKNEELYKTLRYIYKGQHPKELDELRKYLKERRDLVPPAAPLPFVLHDNYFFHPSALHDQPYSEGLRMIKEQGVKLQKPHPALKITDPNSDPRGRCVVTTEPIKKGTILVEYLGEILSHKECERRQILSDRMEQLDRQSLHYAFSPSLYLKENSKKKATMFRLGLDAATHNNTACFLNSACKPNCGSVDFEGPVAMQSKDGTVSLNRVLIEAIEDIPAGAELLINYGWTNFECLCATCREQAEIKELEDWK